MPLAPHEITALNYLLQRGAQHLRAGRLAQARQDCQLILTHQPERHEALNLLGQVALQEGLGRQAKELFSEAARLHPASPVYLADLAASLLALGESGPALERCGRALELDPDQARANYLAGLALAKLGRVPEAMDSLRVCLRKEPGMQPACAALVDLLQSRMTNGETKPAPARTAPPERPFAPLPLVSVIVCSIDEGKSRRVSDHYRSLFGQQPHEIIVIKDAASLCEGYNRGFAQSRGGFVVFSHDDIEILSPELPARLQSHLERYDLIGVAGTDLLCGGSWVSAGWPHLHGLVAHSNHSHGGYNLCVYGGNLDRTAIGGIQALDGLFLAARREVVESLGFDQKTFDGFHLYDLDFTYRAHLAGYRLAVCQDLIIVHHSGGRFDQVWQRYAERFLDKFQGKLSARPPGNPPPWPVAHLPGLEEALAFCQALTTPGAQAGPPQPWAVAQNSFFLPAQPPAGAANLPAAVSLHQQGRLAEAEPLYRQALAGDPQNADAWNLFGLLRFQLGKHQEAADLLSKAIALNSSAADYHSNLGMVLRALGRWEEAVERYREGLRLQPRHPGLLYNLGNAYQDRNLPEEALPWYGQAIALSPDFAEAHYNLGNALRSLGRVEEAINAYQQALAKQPQHPGALNNLGNAYLDRADFAAAVASYQRVLEIAAKSEAGARRPDHAGAHSNIVNCLNYDPGVSRERLFEEHLAWGRRHGQPAAGQSLLHSNTPEPGRRLRLGYISGDFCRHTVAYYFQPVLAAHDRDRFEVFCYSTREAEDEVTGRIKSLAAHWRAAASLPDQELAELIRADGIDILIDLSGHTAHNRLPVLGRRPAPVQASWLGYFNTTGLAAIQYILMDHYAVPPGEERWFSEEVVRLPHGRFCYAPPEYAPEPAPPPCLSREGVVFGSFNNLTKVGPQVAKLWSDLLRRVPGARLVLKWRTLADPLERARVGRMFQEAGLDMAQLELRGPSTHRDMLAEYGDIDIALDPFPFSGGVTSCEALWMGMPVVTWPGSRPVARQTLGYLSEVGLPELVAASAEDYLRIAAELAAGRERLAALRQSLRPAMQGSPLCDGPGFTSALEDALRGMWETWCAGQASSPARAEKDRA